LPLMDIISLPEDLGIDTAWPIQLYEYSTEVHNFKSKISLSKNIISFLHEGVKEIFADGRATSIESDSFVILKSGRCLMTENLSESNKAYRSTLFFFTDAVLIDFLERHKVKSIEATINTHFKVCKYDDFLLHFASGLKGIAKLSVALQQQLLQLKFEELMVYLLQTQGAAFLASLLRPQNDRARHFSEVVESAKLSKLSLQEIAFLCHMSVSTLKREFQKQYQSTPSKWFLEQRLQHAAYLLATNKKRPIDLFDEVGFESLSTFTQSFKKMFGTTPKQFQLEKLDI